MAVPKINSGHGSDTRNVINRAIEVLYQLGSSMENLVAEGQLTPEQYGELIQTINGLISKGEITADDFNKNGRKLDGTFFSADFLEKINNGVLDVTNVLPESITSSEIANGGVTPTKTDFFTFGKNMFDKSKITIGMMVNDDGGELYDAPDYYTSDYIYVIEGVTYTISTASRVVFYNINKVFLNGIRQTGGIYTFTASETGFIRIGNHINYSPDTMQVEKGSNVTPFEPYKSEIKKKHIEVDEDNIQDKSITPDKTTFFVEGKNKFNPAEATYDYFVDNLHDGALRFLEGYVTSDFIPIQKGQNIHMNMMFTIAQYDVNKTYISSIRNTPPTAYTFQATDDGYIRYSFHEDRLNPAAAQAEYNSSGSNFEPYHYGINEDFIKQEFDNKLTGKKLLNFGDSIASAATAGVTGYHQMIAQDNRMQLTTYANGGAKITVLPGETNHIKSQIDEAIADGVQADYILFNGYRNDFGNDLETVGEVTAGYEEELNLETFCGAFEYYCKTLRENWLGAKILYIRTHNTAVFGRERQELYGNLALEICEKWSVPVVDLFKEGGLNTQITAMKGVYTISDTDSTHPNTAGYETFYVPLIENKMKSI